MAPHFITVIIETLWSDMEKYLNYTPNLTLMSDSLDIGSLIKNNGQPIFKPGGQLEVFSYGSGIKNYGMGTLTSSYDVELSGVKSCDLIDAVNSGISTLSELPKKKYT